MTSTALPVELLPKGDFLIGGHLRRGAARATRHHYAATGQEIADVGLADGALVTEAVESARQALPAWRDRPAVRRSALYRLSTLIEQYAAELELLSTLDNGIASGGLAGVAADLIAYNAGWADKVMGQVIPTWSGPALDYTLVEPYGVVGLIIPWNGPLMGFCATAGPALAAGNTVVVKPSELAPFVCLRLGELCLEAGIPAGVVNVVPSDAVGGRALTEAALDKLHFTGSVETARMVAHATAEPIVPLGLELGGKSAVIVFADADVDRAVKAASQGMTALNGQACTNGTRIFVAAAVYAEFSAKLEARLVSLRVTDPLLERGHLGPVVSAAARTRIAGFVARARDRGAGRVVQGRLHDVDDEGYFSPPTVVFEADPASEICREEVFGPVLTVAGFDSEEEALTLANDSRYGLAAYVHTSNLTRAHRVASDLEAGMVWINGPGSLMPATPFGGVKESGYGRLGGTEGIREFTRPKNVWVGL
jgi:aldehyde dehydrogenase (NAD+)